MQKSLFLPCLLCVFGIGIPAFAASDYVIVLSKEANDQTEWKKIAGTLAEKHAALAPETFVYDNDVAESAAKLKEIMPKFVCFVAKPEEAGAGYVRKIQSLTRQLDDDPYPDVRWGILTGYNAEDALKTAEERKPLTIQKVAASFAVNLDRFKEGIHWNDSAKNEIVRKETGKPSVKSQDGPGDPTADMAKMFAGFQPDLWMTSGHATEHDWMIGFTYRAGTFIHKDGQLFGKTLDNKMLPVESPNPKIYMPVGNCLIGHIDNPDCMATAYFHSAGVRQMFGYIVPTWFGYAGWGINEYFSDQPGRFTFNEAYFANQVSLDWCIAEYQKQHKDFDPAPLLAAAAGNFPPEIKLPPEMLKNPVALTNVYMSIAQRLKADPNIAGLCYDRVNTVFYGDPAWEARTMSGQCQWEQKLEENGQTMTLTITSDEKEPAAQPSGESSPWKNPRPIIQWLPHRIKNPKITEGEKWNPVVSDNFILVPRQRTVPSMRIVIQYE